MLKSNKVNLVIAVVVAILLWAYVVGFVDPETTGKVTGVPVTFVNADVLAEEDLAVVDPGEVTVDVTLRGDRSDVRRTTADDITVTADLSALTEGENTVVLDVTVPRKVDLSKVSAETVTVEADTLITKDLPVQVAYDEEGADLEEGEKPSDVRLEPETVSVAGAAATLKRIDRLLVTVPSKILSEEYVALQLPPVPVDDYGVEVGYVRLGTDEVTVTLRLAKEDQTDTQQENTQDEGSTDET